MEENMMKFCRKVVAIAMGNLLEDGRRFKLYNEKFSTTFFFMFQSTRENHRKLKDLTKTNDERLQGVKEEEMWGKKSMEI
jgi:hypothetical protein